MATSGGSPRWIRANSSVIGIYNQFVYVHPQARTVIVKLSANRAYGTSSEERTNREMENLAALRAIARHIA